MANLEETFRDSYCASPAIQGSKTPLAFRTLGEGEPLILLHGLFGSSDNWQSTARALSIQFRLFAVDQRNHGRSPHDWQMDYAVMADDLLEFMDEQGLHKAHVLGHSMGGKTAMQFALNHAARVNKLIVAEMGPRSYPPHHRTVLSVLLALNLTAFRTREEMERALASDIPDLALRRFLLKNLVRDPEGIFHWRIGLREIDANYAKLSEPVTAGGPFERPALFLKGEHSDYLAEGDLPEIRRLFPQARLETIAGAAHLVHVENAPAFQEIVTRFLNEPAL